MDGDGLLNLIDVDSDNDTFSDSREIVDGSNPADANSYSSETLYEDGEHQTTDNWVVIDNDPEGASVTNIYDEIVQSQVIVFTGDKIKNAFRYVPDFNNKKQFIASWDMQTSEKLNFTFSIKTTDGKKRSITYEHSGDVCAERNGNITCDFSKNPNWQSIESDLAADLKMTLPDLTIDEILHLTVRGNGRIDNLELIK